MSFSSEVKDETVKLKLKGNPEKHALLCAVTNTAASITLGRGVGVRYVTENRSVAMLIAAVAAELYDVETAVAAQELERLNAHNTLVSLSGSGCYALLKDAGCLPQSDEEIQRLGHIPEEYTATDNLKRTFLRGAFMGSGSISDPTKGYHLEIVCRRELFAGELCALCNEYGLNAKCTERKSASIVYIKEGERVSDFLTLIGAVGATLQFENTRIVRNLSNDLNRKTNFEDANMQKAALASAQQLIDIECIRRETGFETLPKKLRETAEARLNNPEAPLGELAAELEVSKSGLNHRMKKLSDMAQELRMSRGKPVYSEEKN